MQQIFFVALQLQLNVANMDKSIDYYTKALGMQIMRHSDRPE